jgi:hypothetical protein
VPLVNLHALKRRVTNLFSWRKKDSGSRGVIFTGGTKCAECNEPPVHPHHMGCSHMFCFYCIKVRICFFVYVNVFHTFILLFSVCLLRHMYVVASEVLVQEPYLRYGSSKKPIEAAAFQIWSFNNHTLLLPLIRSLHCLCVIFCWCFIQTSLSKLG